MTEEHQRIAIAEACGWRQISDGGVFWHEETKRSGIIPGGELSKVREKMHLEPARSIPDYLNDLNAMHEAEKIITDWWAYSDHLNEITDSSCFRYQQGLIQATAAQRAEAFLQTLGLWKD